MKGKYKQTKVFIDIETLPAQDVATQARIVANLKAPANYKKPEAIEKWLSENKEDAIRKTSFSALHGSILCIGITLDDEEPVVLHGDEVSILKEFGCLLNGVENPVFIGHNVREFDIKFIIQRQMINGLRPLFTHIEPYYQRPIQDTMEIFCVNPRDRVSLDNLCYALNVETPKGSIDGSKVYDYWLDGKHQEIYDYCKSDVIAMRECYYKLTQVVS